MTNKSTDKSNAEVAARIVGLCSTGTQQSRCEMVNAIESALAAAQSQLAEKVLAELNAEFVKSHPLLNIESRRNKVTVKRLRDLFTRLNIKIGGE